MPAAWWSPTRQSGVLVCEVRAGLRCRVTSAATPPRRQMAPRRGVREDQRHHPLPVARGRPARQRARHLVQSRRNAVAATRFFRKLLKGLRYVPRVLVTDKLASYQVAHRELLLSATHRRSKYLNNRAENSHQPTRVWERVMKRFTSIRHAQRFLSAFSGISPHFRPRRHLLSAADYRQVMALHDLERDHRGDDHGRRLNRPLGHDVSTKPTAQQPESSHRPIRLAQVDNALPRVSYPSLLADRCHPMRRCAAGIALRRSEGAYSLAQQPHDPQQLVGISGLSRSWVWFRLVGGGGKS